MKFNHTFNTRAKTDSDDGDNDEPNDYVAPVVEENTPQPEYIDNSDAADSDSQTADNSEPLTFDGSELQDADDSEHQDEADDSEHIAETAVNRILESDDNTVEMLPVLCQLLDQGITAPGKSYFDIFATKHDDPDFAELFIKEYAKSVPLVPVEKEIERIEQLAAHPSLASAVTDIKLSGVLKSLKSTALSADGIDEQKVIAFCDRIAALPLKSRMIDEFRILADVLRGNYTADTHKVTQTALEIGNKKTILALLPTLINTKVEGRMIDAIVTLLIKKNCKRPPIAAMVSKAHGAQLTSWLSALYADEVKHRGNVIVAELTQEGFSDDEAAQIIATALPDDYAAYLKSLQPGIVTRLVGQAKGLFKKFAAASKSTQRQAEQSVPSAPSKPSTPSKPSASSASAKPSTPSAPSKPSTSTASAKPSAPVASYKPSNQPNAPKSSVTSAQSEHPSTSSEPPKQSNLFDSSTPSDSSDTQICTPPNHNRAKVPQKAQDPAKVIEKEGGIKLY